MKAAYHDRYGPADVLAIREVPRPEPADNEVLVQVHAAGVTTADWRLRASAFPGASWIVGRLMFGLFRPKRRVPGSDFCGRVVARGSKVTRFKLGDAVFGAARGGAHAEYVTVREDGAIAALPAGVTHEDGAATPFGGLSALVFLRDIAAVHPGQRVLVMGASGGVGAFAVQLAKHFGAHVTGVTSNTDLVAGLGADRVIDYRAADVTRGGETFDIVLDPAGILTLRAALRLLTPTGAFVPLEFPRFAPLAALRGKLFGGKQVRIGISTERAEDLRILADLLASRRLRPVIDSRHPLSDVAAANRRVESRHKTGSVLLTLPGSDRLADAA